MTVIAPVAQPGNLPVMQKSKAKDKQNMSVRIVMQSREKLAKITAPQHKILMDRDGVVQAAQGIARRNILLHGRLGTLIWQCGAQHQRGF